MICGEHHRVRDGLAVSRVHTQDRSSWQGRVFNQLTAAMKTQCI
jgi:hypothetical protein